jgi:hypothetical protein
VCVKVKPSNLQLPGDRKDLHTMQCLCTASCCECLVCCIVVFGVVACRGDATSEVAAAPAVVQWRCRSRWRCVSRSV